MESASPSIGLIVFIAALIAGVLLVAATRSQFADELARLTKHHRRMAEKAGTDDDELNIFQNQRNDYLSRVLAQAGLESKYDQYKSYWIVSSVLGGVLFGAILFFCTIPQLAPVGFVLGLPLGAGGFVFYLGLLAKRRQARMTEQLPQVLETMVSSLRAGSPVMECFKTLAETAPDPIRAEFKRGLVALQLGKPFRDTMAEMGVRIKTPDFRLLTQAIFISQDVGGNLADVVAIIAEAIRERFKLRDFLNSLTAQGKATAAFIGCLPYLITAITFLVTPGYIIPFLNHPIARIVMTVLIIWELTGFWILLKMTTFEV